MLRRGVPQSKGLHSGTPAHPGTAPGNSPDAPSPCRKSPVGQPHSRHLGRPRPQSTAPREPTAAPATPHPRPRARARDPAPSPARPSGPRPPHLAGPLHGVGEGVLANSWAAPAGGLRRGPGRPPARAPAAPVPRAWRARWRASPGAPRTPAPAGGRRRPGRGSSRAVVRHGAAGPDLARRLKLRRRRRRRQRRRLNAGTRPRSTRPRSTLGTQRQGRRRGERGTPPPAAVTDSTTGPVESGRRSWATNLRLYRRPTNQSALRGNGRETPCD